MLKEGLYEDFERREQLLGLARFKTTASGGGWRSLKDYVGGAEGEPDRDLLRDRRRISPGSKPRPSSKASGPAASRCCSCPIRSTASG